MTVVSINGLITTTEDTGTGVPTATEDWTSAGHVAGQHSKQNIKNYIENGLRFSVDWANLTFTVSAGLAHVFHPDTIQVQDNDGNYTNDWNEGVTFTNQVPDVTGINLTDGEVNTVWLSLVTTENNAGNIVVEPASGEPGNPKIKLGQIDVPNQTTAYANRAPETRSKTATVQDEIAASDSARIPEGHVQTMTGPLDVEGEMVVDGRLDVLSESQGMKRHDHRGQLLRPDHLVLQDRLDQWWEIQVDVEGNLSTQKVDPDNL